MPDADLDRLLLNWARWACGAGCSPLGYARSSWTGIAARGRRAEAAVPVLAGEASDVDGLINRLPPKLRDALHLRYLRPELLHREAAALAGCHVNTLGSRVEAAKAALGEALAARRVLRRPAGAARAGAAD